MTTLSPKTVWLLLPLVGGLLVAMVSFLYSLVLGGPWTAFLWSGGLSLALIFGIKFASILMLDNRRQLLVAALLWELVGGMCAWTWILLAVVTGPNF